MQTAGFLPVSPSISYGRSLHAVVFHPDPPGKFPDDAEIYARIIPIRMNRRSGFPCLVLTENVNFKPSFKFLRKLQFVIQISIFDQNVDYNYVKLFLADNWIHTKKIAGHIVMLRECTMADHRPMLGTRNIP